MASSTRNRDKKELDPEEIMRRKFRAKCRFRAIARMVLANCYWMIEAAEQYEGVEDVKRRVAQAVRGKAKKKQLLTINDKALLNKPNSERTDHEKKYIYRIIGGLKCFKRYPNHVKKKLAAVTYFKYYSPNRVIVRQHHEAHALYFIVTGDVIVSQLIFDELLQQHVQVDIGIMHPGDMFGEVSLLHNIPRTATCTTGGHCELLALMKEDFKNVLQASVQKQWDEVRRAMSAFTYFDALDEVARREGCIVAKMKSYNINEIILGDGCGIPNFVYFILSGECQMIETLQVCATHRCGHTSYTLYDPYVPKEESEQDIDVKYFNAYKEKAAKEMQQLSQELPEMSRSGSKRLESIMRFSDTKRSGSILKKESVIPEEMLSSEDQVTSSEVAARSGSVDATSAMQSTSEMEADSGLPGEQRSSLKSEVLLQPSENRDSVRFSVQHPVRPPNLRTYFMQVCRYHPGSTFGFGENMRDRRIIALTPVDCMLMPKMWLLQRNTANIWSRIEHFLDKKIPSKRQLFQEFVSARRWLEFRDQLVGDIVARSRTVNWTSVHDVPYSIRMEEMLDI
ncbi:unnamed protein product [Spodoptera littoralis]|uniref:Cyclic nucleotide-binding domain-containing protein n=1 Tax=Spodoptera littoralis TaxID=7109 RepID=A0A9P0N0C3_SPOLI|nr:unnamed protein product [Spodoptera littoralis]CAH1635240.1 unnamed protein product [Spodoptera littoralis]